MAAPTRGNFTKKQGGGTTGAIATTGGANSVMLLCISSDGNAYSVSGTDSAGNTAATWNAGLIVDQSNVTDGDRIRIFALVGGVGNAAHTVPTNTGGADIVFLVEYTGATGVEVYNSTTGTTPFTISTSATTTVAASVIFSMGNAESGTTPVTASCSAATVFSQETDFGTYWGSAIADETVSTVGVKTETWSASPTANRFIRGIVAIKGTASGTSVSPGAGSLVITGYAPTVARTANQAVAPGVGALALTGYAPTVVQNTRVLPGAGSLAITGYAPSIAQPLAVAPGAGTLTITGYAPSISQPQAVAPGAGSITITGYAPTVTQLAGQSVNPGAGSVAITGYAPTVAQTANQAVAPGVGSVVITGFAPTVTQASGSNAVTPGAGVITITGYAPDVAQSQPVATESGGGGGGGSAGGRKKRRKGEKGPLYYRHVEPEDIERMRMAAEEVAAEPEQPRPEAAVRAVSYLKQYGIYREAYAQVLLEMERELREQQALEDDEIMLIMAAAL